MLNRFLLTSQYAIQKSSKAMSTLKLEGYQNEANMITIATIHIPSRKVSGNEYCSSFLIKELYAETKTSPNV
jgi:hypothetical protein